MVAKQKGRDGFSLYALAGVSNVPAADAEGDAEQR
jgi:hypothetical protein